MPKAKMFTQAEVNEMMAYERRKIDEKIGALQVELGQWKASEDELVDTLASHGITIAEGESLLDAGNRFLAQLEQDGQKRSAEHEATLAQLKAEHDASLAPIEAQLASTNARIASMTINAAIHKAAREAGAFNADVVVSLYRDKASLLPNGEVVLKNAVPDFLHSPAELVDHLKNCPEHANLFAPSGR